MTGARRAPRGAPRVALLGEVGVGNVGNDASFAAVAALLRERVPDVRLVPVGRDVGWGDGRAAVRPAGMPAALAEAVPLTSALSRRLRAAGRSGVPARTLSKAADLVHLVRLVGAFDAVVVPGTGVLERAHHRGPGGVLVWLALVSLACRLRRTATAWFAVGGGSYTHRVPAWTAAGAARGAQVRSYRDAETRDALPPWSGAGRDPVAYDVVLSRPEAVDPPVRWAAARETQASGPRRVVVAVIDHDPAPGAPGAQLRERYERRVAELVRALVRSGIEVDLLAADTADRTPVASVLAAVTAQDPGASTRITVHHEQGGLDVLLERVAAADVVVASRYHVLVAAILARRPVVALCHADKDAALLRRLGLEEYLVPVDDVDTDHVLGLVRAAHAGAPRLRARLDRFCRQAHAAVHADADRVVRGLGLVRVTPRAPSPAPTAGGLS